MKTSAFSVYDVKSKIYAAPMFCENEDIAIRNCVAAMGPGSLLTLFPQDFELYYIGDYDQSTGEFFPTSPKYIGRMSDFKVGDNNEV